SPRPGGVNHPDRAIQSIPRKSSPCTGDPIVTLTSKLPSSIATPGRRLLRESRIGSISLTN
ncbi:MULTISPECIES: hypothetical protein, partial [unclassified Bradyrhizobium]|uniref:hypothetical protein n=1 Tax=unclassified Bradyrhizobium TaxID=2631580 RepID=UPI001FF9215E